VQIKKVASLKTQDPLCCLFENSVLIFCFVFFFAFVIFLSLQDAQNLAASWGVPYIECSSKTGENVNEVFHTLLKEIEKDDGLLSEAEENQCIIL